MATMTHASTVFADIGWLLVLCMLLPLAVLAVGAPFVLIARLLIAIGERL
jgi:hypothetical protein